jgi:hypothetical protein
MYPRHRQLCGSRVNDKVFGGRELDAVRDGSGIDS